MFPRLLYCCLALLFNLRSCCNFFQVSPGSSFGVAPVVRPYGAPVCTLVGAKTELLSSSGRSEQHGRDGWALSAGGKESDAGKEVRNVHMTEYPNACSAYSSSDTTYQVHG